MHWADCPPVHQQLAATAKAVLLCTNMRFLGYMHAPLLTHLITRSMPFLQCKAAT